MEKQETYLSVKEYASKYNESVHNIYNLIKRGKLTGKKIGNYQLVKDIPRA